MWVLGGTNPGHMVTPPRDDARTAPAGDAMAVVDVRGIVTGWMQGARLLTGYPADEVTGRPAAELLEGDPASAPCSPGSAAASSTGRGSGWAC